jgi:hypothetical protein
MAKLILTEALEALQEYDFMGGPGMDQRPDYTTGVRDPRNAKFNFRNKTDQGEDWPYEDDNYIQYGKSMGVKGRDRGSRPGEDMSGGPPVPKYQNTWEGAVDDEEDEPIPVGEGADFDEIERHHAHRNKWRDTPTGRQLKKMVDGEAVDEAMGTPIQTGAIAPMDGPAMQTSRSAKPVKDVDGDDVSQQYIPDPVDPMRGPGNMWGGPGTVPGTSRGWGTAPGNQKKLRRENLTMKLREFFDPSPIAAEAIDNPEQDKHGDATDDELETGDVDGMESPMGDAPDEDEMLASMFDNDEDKDGDEVVDPDDMAGMADTEPGDGSDLGSPETMLLMPHIGHGTDHVMSPDRMGGARGTYGMHSDGGAIKASTVDKSSAWDVLSKVVNSLDVEEEVPEINPRPVDGL